MSLFVEVRVTDLIGAALDHATGIALGRKIVIFKHYKTPTYRVLLATPFEVKWPGHETFVDHGHTNWAPSTDWAIGGPLIERHQIELTWDGTDGVALWWKAIHQEYAQFHMGDTPLIAACRAIVAAHCENAETVLVPAELLP